MQNLELWHERIFALNKVSFGSWMVYIKSLVESRQIFLSIIGQIKNILNILR
jgi:hypothetical protein